MRLWFLIGGLILVLSACATSEKQYYQNNPKALQKAISACPAKHPSGISCDELANMASTMNQLAYQLQMNPQRFGKKILALQERLAVQQANLRTNSSQPDLKVAIEKNKQQLSEYLTVVKWLESPES